MLYAVYTGWSLVFLTPADYMHIIATSKRMLNHMKHLIVSKPAINMMSKECSELMNYIIHGR